MVSSSVVAVVGVSVVGSLCTVVCVCVCMCERERESVCVCV